MASERQHHICRREKVSLIWIPAWIAPHDEVCLLSRLPARAYFWGCELGPHAKRIASGDAPLCKREHSALPETIRVRAAFQDLKRPGGLPHPNQWPEAQEEP